ncbi:peptidoglycan DD-metalloendopeptidase family protein [Aquimarina addita]|uniref:Peptidoglycan DD-metalloendopeptidase family protein n=1 Tax=Aquimarina addita TaxID=870485 RepID=A0ABP6URI1_9FLAO
MYKFILITSFLSVLCIKEKKLERSHQEIVEATPTPLSTQDPYTFYDTIFKENPEYIADTFDFPVGKPNGKGYYNALKFGKNAHLGDDWNGVGGGNTDLGDSIYSIANGYVSFAEDIGGGWGNVIRIVHRYNGKYYESLYAHCDTIVIKKGGFIKKGTLIGTIGNAHGIYMAHLHLELRSNIFMDIGGGYATDTTGFLDPTQFIKEN